MMCPFYGTFQMCNFDTDTVAEELAHLEMVATIVHQLTCNLSRDEIENSGCLRTDQVPARTRDRTLPEIW